MKLKSPEVIFVIFAFVFGMIIMFLTPKFGVSDEYAHLARAKEVSKGIFYNKILSGMSQNELNNLGKYHGASGYSPVMYLASGTALKLTQNLDENIQFYFGRFANLLVWIFLIALAIRITPVFKWAFFMAGLLPMNIFEGMSYSADSFSNAFAFLYFAYLFQLIYGGKEFSYKKDLPLLFVFAITGALCKGLIFPVLLTFLIPMKKNKIFICSLLTLISVSVACFWSSHNFIALAKGVDYLYNKHYALTNPLEHLQMIVKTYIHLAPNFAGQVIGKLGWQRILLSQRVYHMTFFTFIGIFAFLPETLRIRFSHRLFAFLLFFGYLFCTAHLMYCMCNTPEDIYVVGMQGRYFISAIPLLFIMFAHDFSKFRCEKYKIFIVSYSFLLLVYTCYILYDVLQLGPQFFF